MELLTFSSARQFRRCAREYRWRHELGIVSARDATPLRFGRLVHEALKAWWLAEHDRRIDAALVVLETADADPFERVRAEVLLQGYHVRWHTEPLETVATEVEFRAPLINPATSARSKTWEIGGKIDAIARTPDGRIWVVEHKTTSEDIEPGSAYWQRLTLDAQVSTYFVGARALGHDVSGCLYDVLRKPQQRPYSATPTEQRKYTKAGALYATQHDRDQTPEEFRARLFAAVTPDNYRRGEVVRLTEEEQDAAYDLWQTGRLIREAQLAGRWPRNPDACERFGRMCDYWPLCSRTGSVGDAELYRIERPHSELEETAA